MQNDRVIVYIDGFNLYFGLRSKGWRRYYWLNLQNLAQSLLKANQRLVWTKYFTSRVSLPPDKQRRQSAYIEALETLNDFQIFYGQYQSNPWPCPSCGVVHNVQREKMTDVNIAVQLMKDAFEDNFDTALLVSADSDLVAPIDTTRRLFPLKRMVVVFPPARYSAALQRIATGFVHIDKYRIRKSLFPPEVQKADGIVLKCPKRWR